MAEVQLSRLTFAPCGSFEQQQLGAQVTLVKAPVSFPYRCQTTMQVTKDQRTVKFGPSRQSCAREMRQFAIGCAPVLVCMALLQSIVARKPTMIPAGEELLIQEGDELMIKCKGEGKLQFPTQWNVAGIRQSDFTISANGDSGWYTFTRPNVTRVDTGWYACAEEGIEIQNDEQTIDHPVTDIGWIYVYVNSSAPFAAFEDITMLFVMRERPLVIPCRPTSPNLSVVMDTSNLRNENPTYDPKIGFILDSANEYEWIETYTCKLDETYGAEELRKDYISTMTFGVLRRDLEPEIKPGPVIPVVLGQNLTSKCEVSATATGPKVPVIWEPPHSVATGKSSRHRTTERQRYESFNGRTFSTTLTIDNLEEADLGEYTCVAKDPSNGATAWTGTIVRIADPDVISKEKLVYAYEKQFWVTLQCDAEWKPLSNFTWVKNYDSDHFASRGHDITSEVDEFEGKPILVFWRVHRNDNGTYECWTKDNNGRNISSRVSLIVFGKPDISSIDISQDVGPDSFLLRWTIHDGNSPVKYYPIQLRRNDTGPWEDTMKIFRVVNSSYLITDLDKSTDYEFKMTATNSIGVSSPVRWSWSSRMDKDPRSIFNHG